MANEPIQGGPYPVPGDSPDGPSQMKAINDWAAVRLNMRFASTAARDAAIPSPVAGMECAIGSGASQVKYIYDGTAWRVFYEDTGWLTLTPAAGFTGPAAMRRKSGVVYLRGTIQGSFTANATTVIATLPPAFSPGGTVGVGVGTSAGAAGWGAVASSGTLQVRAPSTGTHNFYVSALGGFTVD